MYVVKMFFGHLLFVIIVSASISKGFTATFNAENFVNNFSKHFEDYLTEGRESQEFQELRRILSGENSTSLELENHSSKANGKVCLQCYAAVANVLKHYKTTKFTNEDNSKQFLEKLCIYTSVGKSESCNGNVKIYFDVMKYILTKREDLTWGEICGILFQGFLCGNEPKPYEGIPVEKPVLIGHKKSFSNSTNTLKILHLTDLHYDAKYVVGSNAACDEWVCCRGEQVSNNSSAKAGKWGDLRPCDSPGRTITNLLENIALHHTDIDAIYLTGDYNDHFGWERTKEDLIHALTFVTEEVQKFFPNTPVLPVLGNHDTYPDNLYAPNSVEDSDLSSVWVYEMAANLWKKWLHPSAYSTFKQKGYYTMLLRPNLRIVGLNSNVCFMENLWLLLDHFYFREQLEWLGDVLYNASLANEKVHILSHVPPNEIHCYNSWSREFKKLIERYTHIVSAQFNGHSHLDEFALFYAEDDPLVALNVAWNGGSTTTFPNVNPNYKVYYINDESYEVTNYQSWILNLTEANAHPDENPKWNFEYDFKSYFGVDDLSPASIHNLLEAFLTDRDLLKKFCHIQVKQSSAAIPSKCDPKNLLNILSSTTRTYFDNSIDFAERSVSKSSRE